jgi:hypothetical protein
VRSDLYIESVLAKCEALKRSGIWAPEPKLRPSAWLNNFKNDSERLIAAILLDNFIFYSDRAADRLLLAAFDRLEDDVLTGAISFPGRAGAELLSDLIFTPVEGEDPRPTDSGKALCGKLRDLAQVEDRRFFDPHAALQQAALGAPVVFVDDFLGSGRQLITTWKREYLAGAIPSFEAAYAASAFPAICIAMVATECALRNLGNEGIPIIVVATHVLEDGYGVAHLEPPALTPPIVDFQASLRAFLGSHAAALTLPNYLQAADSPLYGFYQLGLLFSLERKPPDCTLPIFWAPGPQEWICLVK